MEIIEVEEIIEAIKDEEISKKERETIKRYIKATSGNSSIGATGLMELAVQVVRIKDNDGGKGMTTPNWLKKIDETKKTTS